MRIFNRALITGILTTVSVTFALANQERSGQAGADQLLVNAWGASSGLGATNMANVTGFESMNNNAGGLVGGMPGTEVGYTRTSWLSGSDININTLGFKQSLGMDNENALGISLTSFDMGEITRTTASHPERELGTYTPQFFNLGIGYSRLFSHAIRGGVVLRIINERIDEVGAQGVALDAGIQYIAGDYDHIRFGIALRNVGPPMRMTGDGLTVRGTFSDVDFDLSLQQRSQRYEIPSVLAIGASYAFQLERGEVENEDGDLEEMTLQALTFSGIFNSNSFSSDQIGLGVEYNFRDRLMLRSGYVYEENILTDDRTNAYTGPSAGASLRFPLGAALGAYFQVDYAFRYTQHFNHTHNFGGRITF